MKQPAILSAVAAIFLLATNSIKADEPLKAHAIFVDNIGQTIGEANLTQGDGGVLLHVKVAGLLPGAKGLHLHGHGSCDIGDDFKSEKLHVENGHGSLSAGSAKEGDVPTILIASDRRGEIEIYTTQMSLTDGVNNLLDADGSAFVIHDAYEDGHMSQPVEGIGGRIACGIIKAVHK